VWALSPNATELYTETECKSEYGDGLKENNLDTDYGFPLIDVDTTTKSRTKVKPGKAVVNAEMSVHDCLRKTDILLPNHLIYTV
jgi:hypothetical protein